MVLGTASVSRLFLKLEVITDQCSEFDVFKKY